MSPKRTILPLLCSKFPSRVQISCACPSQGARGPTRHHCPHGQPLVLASQTVLIPWPRARSSRRPRMEVRAPGAGTLGRRQGLRSVVLSGKRINKCKQAVTAGFIRLSGDLVLSICCSVSSANATEAEAGAQGAKTGLQDQFKSSTCMTYARSPNFFQSVKKE